MLFIRAIQILINATVFKTAVNMTRHSSKSIYDFITQMVIFMVSLKCTVNCIIYLRTATETWRLAVFCGINNTTAK